MLFYSILTEEESGLGKTTVGKCILRLEGLTEGEVFFDDEPMGHIPLTEMTPLWSRMQMVFQEPYSSLNPRLSVRTAVEEPLKLLTDKSPNERNERILETFDLLALKPQVLDLFPHGPTGGHA